MDHNSVTLSGRVGNNPVLKKTETGKFVTGFRLATNFTWPDGTGKLNQKTDWHNVVAWNEQAEQVAAVLQSGSEVFISGSLRTRSYDKMHKAKKGGTAVKVKHFITEVVAKEIRPLGVHLNGERAAA